MVSNPANQSLEDQFLSWHQDMEAKQEEQARQMAELQSHADHLQQENDHLRACLEDERIENARGSSYLAPLVKKNKGKEPIRPNDSNAQVAPRFQICHLQKTMWRSSQGRGPHVVPIGPSAACLIGCRENSVEKGSNRSTPLKTYPRGKGTRHHHFRSGVPPSELHQPRIHLPTAIRVPEDMLSSLLGQHILSYEPPRGFVISSFTKYDGSSNPYDHMVHFNQAMILNTGDNRLLCKVFPASLKEPALA